MPVLQHTANTLFSPLDGANKKRKNYHSVGAFKPWCGGWSFRKQALSMGTMPDKGYFYTTLTFRKKDLSVYFDTESEAGIAPGGIRWTSYKNTGHWIVW